MDSGFERLQERPPTTDRFRRPAASDFNRGALMELPNIVWVRAPRAASRRPTELRKMPPASGPAEKARNCALLRFARIPAAPEYARKSPPEGSRRSLRTKMGALGMPADEAARKSLIAGAIRRLLLKLVGIALEN